MVTPLFWSTVRCAPLPVHSATRMFVCLMFLIIFALAECGKAYAVDPRLKVFCVEEDKGADVFINDEYTGACPLEKTVVEGDLRLKVQKRMDAVPVQIFEQTIRIGKNADVEVNVPSGATQLKADGESLQPGKAAMDTAGMKSQERQDHQNDPHALDAHASILHDTSRFPENGDVIPAADGSFGVLPPVVVTASPMGSALLDLVLPVSVLTEKDLLFRQEATLGETLSKLPGISSTYFGPNSSRPIIRGLDGDRIRILQNGVAMLDVSSLSPDHATAVDPLLVDRVEVVRGPAALMYGGAAVGGVVNTLDNRIPQLPVKGFTGRFEPRFGGAASERSGAAMLEAGNGQFAIHADIASRRTDDLRIPGYARSSRQRAADGPEIEQPHGRLPNSSSSSDSGSVGASLTSENGYFGLSYSDLQSNFGTVAEPDVRVDMSSKRLGMAGEIRELNTFVQELKFKYNHTDYLHNELEGGEVATTFKNKGYDTRIDAVHSRLGAFTGAFGVQLTNVDFAALGESAFLPQVNTDSKALFLYEEATFGKIKLTAGGRNEHASVESAGDTPDTTRFGSAQSRQFTASSGALGALYSIDPKISLAANLTHTERVPTYAELFSNGRHVATGQFVVGDSTLQKEKSNGADVHLRWRSGLNSVSIGGFYNHFQNYIALLQSGQKQEDLTEAFYRPVKAEFYGFEMEGKSRIYEQKGNLDLNLRGDYVRAKNSDTGEPLPRIAPLRLGVGLDYQLGNFGARFDVSHSFRQDRVASSELSTGSYTLADAMLTYRIKTQGIHWDAYLKGNNLFNEEARTHTSFLKEIAPLPGRGFIMGVRGTF